MVELGSIGKCWVLAPESPSPLQTLRQTLCKFLHGAFLGLLCFESLVFPHGAPLGCVRPTLKQQTTDAITIADCCETLFVM